MFADFLSCQHEEEEVLHEPAGSSSDLESRRSTPIGRSLAIEQMEEYVTGSHPTYPGTSVLLVGLWEDQPAPHGQKKSRWLV